jgi:hypothetical protein
VATHFKSGTIEYVQRDNAPKPIIEEKLPSDQDVPKAISESHNLQRKIA